MKSFLFRIWFSLSSFSWILLFFLINKDVSIPFIDIGIKSNYLWIKYVIIFIIIFFYARLILYYSYKKLGKSDTLQLINWDKKGELKPAEWVFLPVYIWLFVVALELGNPFTLEISILLIFLFILWCFFEWVSYFNPIFLFFWYRFYEIKDVNNINYMLITKRKDMKSLRNFSKLTRINNFTFLEYQQDE